jgi:hypothetical protein
MTLQTRRGLLLIGILIVAGLLAFPLRGLIYEGVVIPAAFIVWNLGLFYHSFSQAIWWGAMVVIVLFMLLFSLIPQPRFRRSSGAKRKPQLGQVEDLVVSLGKAEQGIYFKWLVANRLGKLAHQILLHRESGHPRSVFAPLSGVDWEPSKELQDYLETGLHGSFADFPNANRRLGTAPKTPLEFEIVEAVEFLESQVENGHSPERD